MEQVDDISTALIEACLLPEDEGLGQPRTTRRPEAE
jgi:hypothetical protein